MLLLLLLFRCTECVTTRRRQLSWPCPDEVVCRYRQSAHTRPEHSADSAQQFMTQLISAQPRHAVCFLLDGRHVISAASWTRGDEDGDEAAPSRLTATLIFSSSVFCCFGYKNVSIDKVTSKNVRCHRGRGQAAACTHPGHGDLVHRQDPESWWELWAETQSHDLKDWIKQEVSRRSFTIKLRVKTAVMLQTHRTELSV